MRADPVLPGDDTPKQAPAGAAPAAPAAPPAPPTPADDFEPEDYGYDPELDGPYIHAPAKPAATPAEPAPSQPSEPAFPPGAPKPQAGVHDPRLAAAARDYGFSDEEIAQYSPQELQAAVGASYRAWSLAQQQWRQPEPAQPPPQKAPDEPQIDWGRHADETGSQRPFTEEDVSPAIAHVLKQQAKELASLKAQLAERQQAEQRREAETMAERLDRLFEGRSDLFGKGAGRELRPESPEMLKRMGVLGVMERLSGSIEQRYQKAVEAMYGAAPVVASELEPKKPAPPRDPETGRIISREESERRAAQERWQAGGLARPTQRVAADLPKGPQRAVRALAAHMRDSGLAVEDYGGPEEEGLPG